MSDAVKMILFLIGIIFIILGAIILSDISKVEEDETSLLYAISTVANGIGLGLIVFGIVFMIPLFLDILSNIGRQSGI